MNASEMEYAQARMPFGLKTMPTPEEMERLIAKMRRERNDYIAASFVAFVAKVRAFAGEARRIAVACTAARLHQKTA